MSHNLDQYFTNTQGKGILATADASGVTNAAIYSRPHIIDEETVAFVMRAKKTYDNVGKNPNATYLFIEDGHGYKGKRLYLKKSGEENNIELIDSLRMKRSQDLYDRYKGKDSTLVYFKVQKILPLIGEV